jgi:branched-chain amino acid transport system ATP-binding protein
MTPVVELDAVSAAYGPFRALFDVSLALPEGTTMALLGPNGAGKSTVARVLSGLVPPSGGRVRLEGVDATGWSTVRIRRAGVLHVPEGRGTFSSLTVEQNLTLALSTLPRRRRRALVEAAYERFAILGQRRGQRAGTLSGGQQRLLSLAAALVDPPKVLVADEISLGLAPAVLDEVYAAIGELTAAGTAVLLIEQQTSRAVAAADVAVVLAHGRVAFQGPPAEAAAVLAAGISTTGTGPSPR